MRRPAQRDEIAGLHRPGRAAIGGELGQAFSAHAARHGGDGLSLEGHLPARDRHQPGHGFEQGRFAAPFGPTTASISPGATLSASKRSTQDWS